ncbi:MAG TPA: DUF2520 domain-containing protein [Bacteroidales bacterium]|jgi:predicted short-subunit dehydrogenase-like oxidoreductase (DUF2520 family)|nr:DUF2520 domain-containing protein [Bacteroidales bacterium]
MQIKAVIIGAGNVGTHLAIALKNEGVQILQIVSRTMKSAVELASRMECGFTTDIHEINKNADIYIVCVTDNAIIPVLRQLQIGNKFIVHTSGSMGIEVFYDLAQNYGVVYPMQTFSKFKDINYAEIPIFIEANTPENEQMLFNFVKKISPHVQVINSQQRCMLHICAVFANNFTNHMCTIAELLMKENQIKFETFKPLLRETFEKITKYSPSISQTGPAMRKDIHVVQKHIDILAQYPSFQEIYRNISNSILEMYKKEE